MRHPLFRNRTAIRARALFVGQRIDLNRLDQGSRIGVAPLLVRAGDSGCVVLFRYGALVHYGLSAEEEAAFLAGLRPWVIDPFSTNIESEEVTVASGHQGAEGVEQGRIVLQDFAVERLQLVADILAKSVVLAYYEMNIAASFDRIEPLAERLRAKGRGGRDSRALLRQIGDTLLTHGKMVARVEVAEKPELLWEHPVLERLYLRLEDEYELRERHLALERKLDLVSRTAETLLGLLQSERGLRVEWYIVILILIEIVLSLYGMFA